MNTDLNNEGARSLEPLIEPGAKALTRSAKLLGLEGPRPSTSQVNFRADSRRFVARKPVGDPEPAEGIYIEISD